MPMSSPNQLAVTIGQWSEAGPKPINQDFHGALVPDGSELALKGIAVAIADGISSSKVSQIAAEIAVKSLLTDYYCASDAWTAKTAGERVIRAANAWLYAESRRNALHGHMGYVCTLSALILKGRAAHIFHIGDSRICQLAGDSLEPLTRDHRVEVSSTESYLNRAVGVEPDVDIDYLTTDLNAGDVFVLSTDGVHEHLNPREMAAIISAAGDLDAAARDIVTRALANGSDDNLTVQIVRVDSVPAESAHDVLLGLDQLKAAEVAQIPCDIDGFRVVREIHVTDRSEVYVAIDTESGEHVALKVLAPGLWDNPDARRRLAMEEWVARRLNSPHVVRAVRPHGERNSLYTVCELIEGQTLRQWMNDNPHPNLATVRAIVDQIAKGLRAFQRKEMLHQDIRPENIMIDKTGTVKIIDLGSVRVAGVAEAVPAIDAGDVLGTFQYAAPEYFLGKPGTFKSDLYSLGVVAYEMVAGWLPYGDGVARAKTPKAQAALIYTSARENAPNVPEWMDAALRKAVSIDPAARHEALSEFVTDLSQPSATYKRPAFRPLSERNPLLFWKSMCLVLALTIVALLATR